MAQISQTLYNTIAVSYAEIDTALSGISASAQTALYAIVDVDTLDYPNASGNDPAAALEIELALLQTFNNAFISAGNIQNSNSSLLTAVKAANDFVVAETAGTDTATIKLNTWINTTMNGYWVACPSGWASISADAGYTTTAWVTV